jgi:hypothetical protein
MNRLSSRIGRLEQLEPVVPYRRAFLWGYGQSLADALADAKLTLEDGPLLAIELMPAGDVTCPLHDRDRHLLAW